MATSKKLGIVHVRAKRQSISQGNAQAWNERRVNKAATHIATAMNTTLGLAMIRAGLLDADVATVEKALKE